MAHIGLTGSMSVGKSSLIKALKKTPEFKEYFCSIERSKYLRDLGIPLNTDSTINGQLIFLAERSSELLHGNLLTDRSIWDVCAFTMLAKSIDLLHKSQFVNTAMMLKDQYDIIFYISPEGVEIENNSVRETDPKYRMDIDEEIKRLLKLFPPKKLIMVPPFLSVKERVKFILDTIN